MRTASTCTPCAATGTHAFKIAGHSLHRGLGVGKYISSATFDVGGYLWRIQYYPDGEMELEDGDHASVFLRLVGGNAQARAFFEARLVDQNSKPAPLVVVDQKTPLLFHSRRDIVVGDDFLHPLAYLRDDSLLIECDVTVMKEPNVALTTATFDDIQVPPSDLGESLGKFLETGEGADVNFKVKGQIFHAHKAIVAARSPVFKAELFGPMSDMARRGIRIEDMQPVVFKALLHFIYTDSLPSMENLDGDEVREMVKHLLVAADRYAMERMKLMCESILCKSLDSENVTSTLALADQYHCSNLKDACLDFVTSPDRMDDVFSSQGYAQLKRSCPTVVIDMLERATKSRKI